MAVSFQCMTKSTTNKNLKKKEIKNKRTLERPQGCGTRQVQSYCKGQRGDMMRKLRKRQGGEKDPIGEDFSSSPLQCFNAALALFPFLSVLF